MSSAVEHVELPGVGVRSTFATNSGRHVGVLTHHSGVKELLVYAEDDPDRCAQMMSLDEGEAQAMADLLASAPLSGETSRLLIGTLVVTWLEIDDKWWIHGRTATSVDSEATSLGVVRDGKPISAADAGPLVPGDVVLLAGTAEQIDSAARLLESGP